MSQKSNKQTKDETRREFLRKSVYAAYATPVITALLVSEVSAKLSQGAKDACEADGGRWFKGSPQSDPCCDRGPGDGCGPGGG